MNAVERDYAAVSWSTPARGVVRVAGAIRQAASRYFGGRMLESSDSQG